MCGITGIFSLKREGSFKEQVQRMNRCLAHRGPDNDDVYDAPGLALGHRRLSIIDLSAAGNQPMTYADERYVIIYNGELYNYRELRKELSDVQFKTASDTEVILAAYARWGEKCLDRFNGMFAFAIWDEAEQKLFIARDRLGIKPLYYWFDENKLVFASEIRAVLASGMMPAKLYDGGLGDYLSYQTAHAPYTILDGIAMLEPGHTFVVRRSDQRVYDNRKPYWELGKPWSPPGEILSYEQVCREVRELFFAAVERRLVADVPFGAFLSGGIDSSAVVGVMSQVAKTKVKTFSVVFDESEFSEAKYARMIAEKFSTEHHEIKLSPEDFLNELPAALAAMDHPSGDGPNTYVVSKATKAAGIKMALSGLGGDELFAGYGIFKRALDFEKKKWIASVPAGIRRMAGSALQKLRPGIPSDKLAELLSISKIELGHVYALSRKVLTDQQIKTLWKDCPGDSEIPFQAIRNAQSWKMPLLSAISYAEMSTYMQNVLLRDADQMSMAHALEVRVPFLDYKLVEYVLALPDQYKYPHTPKKLLVDALGELLPPEIVNRPKMGFTFPWKHWMKKELRSFCEERLTWLGANGVLNEAGLRELWQAFLRDDPRVTWSRVWPLVVLGDWMQRNNIQA